MAGILNDILGYASAFAPVFAGFQKKRHDQAAENYALQRQAEQDAMMKALNQSLIDERARSKTDAELFTEWGPEKYGQFKSAGQRPDTSISQFEAYMNPATRQQVLDYINAQKEAAAAYRAPPQPPSMQLVFPPGGEGPVLFNPKAGTIQEAPGGLGGKPQITAKQKTDMQQNMKQLGAIDSALTALDAYPTAVGARGAAPDWLLQRADPRGTAARSLIANIGSLEIRDRSGAAVTAAEFPRLRPFIPNLTDTAETVRTKLRQMKRIIEEENAFITSAAQPGAFSQPQQTTTRPTASDRARQMTGGTQRPTASDRMRQLLNK